MTDLRSDDGLRNAINGVLADTALSPQAGIPDKLKDSAFLERLWEDEAVSSTGMGSVKVDSVRNDPGFRDWFAEQASKSLPTESHDRERQLISLYDELIARSKEIAKRRPVLKVNRLLAALYPGEFTTMADVGKLRDLHRAMGGSTSDHVVVAHRRILGRLSNLLGSVLATDFDAIANRISLPWYLYELIEEKPDDDESKPPVTPHESKLNPMPPLRRRKGLTAIAGLFPGLLSVAGELKDDLTRDELFDYYRHDNPDLKDSSISTQINALCKEFAIAKREGERYELTAAGLNLLESNDSDALADHLLTRILGIDNIVVALRGGPQSRAQLRTLLRSLNPGWTSNFAPDAMLSWLHSMGVLERKEDGSVALTERGFRWGQQVTWEPAGLKAAVSEPFPLVPALPAGGLKIPPFKTVFERLITAAGKDLVFDSAQVAQLHAGLWAHSRRHFAVLTGLSGSGKTQLALQYSLALVGRGELALGDQVLVVPVQPGWYDPTPLLGYVNPLEAGYRTAPFLQFLQEASDDPDQPYLVILDEMNLSHPEQYLAPVLSAIEIPSGMLDLHRLGPGATSVPERVPYPSNLAVIGTINNDETTHGLSDKVLDRAFTLEFWNVPVGSFPGWGDTGLTPEVELEVRQLLSALAEALSPVRMHFGYRVINDVVRYMAYSLGMGREARGALDEVVYAKILPKLRGEGSPRFTKALESCRQILANLPQSRAKIQEFLNDLQETGTAKFWR